MFHWKPDSILINTSYSASNGNHSNRVTTVRYKEIMKSRNPVRLMEFEIDGD